MSWTEIDRNIRELVETLNSLPGIKTRYSCGGHEKVTNISQAPAGNWYVVLYADAQGLIVLDQVKAKIGARLVHYRPIDVLPWKEEAVTPDLWSINGIGLDPAEYIAALQEVTKTAGIEPTAAKIILTQAETSQKYYDLNYWKVEPEMASKAK